MVTIEVFGTGCAKCKRTAKNVEKAVAEMGIEAEVVKIEEINAITDRGVLLTPALAVNGEMKVEGRVPTVDEVKEILSEAA
ncbi:small redox-active disulfide protein 2 [Methanofollis sp. W23]|uniref:thioredoxin family protein n=1 Tax=Methanofollis sp. W23 TaxID=2817849 RepID=UPI001AE14FA5|nr:thioredoxin family protein [Methanofollis sp. W23]MBP2146630.1 small redox-active disulfide protein 2 [Methanofollis sp. W23]